MNNLKYPFIGQEKISNSYSQVSQDVFVLSLLKGKQNGTYLEVGAGWTSYINNTYLLATEFNWTGISIDFDATFIGSWENERPNDSFLCCDATTCDYSTMLKDKFGSTQNIIDYLQLDTEPASTTFAALKKIPFDNYRFRVITFETDLYTGGDAPRVREDSRAYLSSLGYTMIVPDVLVSGNPFEDWWVDMDLVDIEVANGIKTESETTQDPFKLLYNTL